MEEADKKDRVAAFRRIAKRIMGGREERTKYGFNSDTNGEIARAMEWAFQAGRKAAQTKEGICRMSESQTTQTDRRNRNCRNASHAENVRRG
ncbi:hypothetical protein [Acidiphilium sp. JA12-A1]|uniref:hypothetical protein n=1 Tax=Acidiphilium sp. JA12-A1 TaxID=1464546 RepID=UPI00128F868E|nr:hypothetical protein [Acidiphilium sp. JA12-A1]